MKKSRKDGVVKTANCMIRKIGYSNLSFSQIAKDLDVTRENVHHYFKKKEILGNACLEMMFQDLDEYLQNIISQNISSLDKLKEYFSIYKNQQTNKEDCPIVSLLNEYDLLPLSMKNQVQNLYSIELDYMQKILEEGLNNKEFSYIEEPIFKAQLIITQLKGAISYVKLEDNFDEIINHVIHNLISNKIFILSDKKVNGAVNLPVIDIKYINQTINTENYDALIFTSKNAIKALDSMDENWKTIPSYVIAPQTAKVLESLDGNLCFVGEKNHGNDFAEELVEQLKGKKVLYIRGKKVISNLENILNENGVFCENKVVYETVCKQYKNRISLPKNSTIIFSSPSTIECFLKNITWDKSYKAISIGKTTAKYFPEYIVPIIADTTSLDSCVQKAIEVK